MEATLSLQKEVTLLESIVGVTPPVAHSTLDKQTNYILSLFQNSMTADSWNHPKVQPVLMRLLLALDQKAFAVQYPNQADYTVKLTAVLKEFIAKSSLFATFAKQLNLFFSKKKFAKFQNAVRVLGFQAQFVEVFQASILKEIEKDFLSLEKESKILAAGAYSFLTEDFICGKMIPFFGKILRKSMKNLSKIRAWLNKLPQASVTCNFTVLTNLLVFLDSNICDALNKDESFQTEVFKVSQSLLQNLSQFSHANEKVQNAVAKFLTNMTMKLKSKRNDNLMLKFVKTLLCLKGKQSAKIIKLVVDGFWIALANTKADTVILEIKSLFIGLRRIDNLPELLKNLSAKMKDKKDLIMIAPLINNMLRGFDFLKMKLTGKGTNSRLSYNGKNFDCSALEELARYVHKQISQISAVIGQKSADMISSVPGTASATLLNFLSYSYNAYFALLSKVGVTEVTAEAMEQLKKTTSKTEVIQQFFAWRQQPLNAVELKAKVISLLFKSNSILFRRSLADSLSAADCKMILNLIKMIGVDLASHIQKKKLESVMSLLVFELVSKVLQSPESSDAYVFGKYVTMVRALDRSNQWNVLSVLTATMSNGFFFSDLLVNEFSCELLLNGMFIQMAGGRYSLDTHLKISKIFSFLKYEHIDVFAVARASKYTNVGAMSAGLKLICLLSLNNFDNESCLNLLGWDKVIAEKTKDSVESQVYALANNFSQVTKGGSFSSITIGSLKDIMGDDEDKINDFFERLLSDEGLFSRNFTVRCFCRRLLALLTLNESKAVFHRVNWLLKVANLRKLTRMNKIIRQVQMCDLELEKEELSQPHWFSERLAFLLGSFESATRFTDALKDYGYNDAEDVSGALSAKGFPDASEFAGERTGLFELCSELTQIKDNEDEEMAELELNSRKEAILGTFCFYIENLSLSLSELLSLCSSVTPEEEKRIAQDSIILLNSVQDNIDDEHSYMRRNLRVLFQNVYFLASRQNNVNELVEFFYYIKTGRDDSTFIRSIERKCEAVLTRPEYFSEHLFDMFFQILNFLVAEKLSAKAKKNLLIIVVGFLDKFPSFEKKIFKFLVDSINSFYFDFAFERIDFLLKKAYASKGDDCDMLDSIFQNILHYQDYARERVCNILCASSEALEKCQMRVTPLSKLKLIFLSRDQDSNVVEQSTRLLKLQNLQFNMDSFLELSFEEMLIEFPTDTHDTFALIFFELYSALSPGQKNTFISEITSTFSRISQDLSALAKKYQRFEFRLMLLPKILSKLVAEIKGKSFISLFSTFNKVEESKLSKLTDTCIALGRDLIVNQPAELSRLISCQAKQMDPSRPLITPIVFVAECAKVNPHLSSQIGDLQSNLERMLVLTDKDFLRSLAKQLRYLIKFLKDPQALFERLFADILRNSSKDTLIGSCYFVAGLLKGLGVRFFKKASIISKMQIIFSNSRKKDYKDIHVRVRKGCVLLAEALWLVFDRLLEPCLKEMLEFLLKFLGDTNEEVRTLTREVMDKVMCNISEFGIKQILPVLMKGTTDKNSKIKCNSILALGSIANCGTKQLSQNLPRIVPQLTEATNDTNDMVNSAAKTSLSQILSTIKSPEVANLRDVLIKSLSDPFNHNMRSLEAILKTKFKHALDGPSLSLIVPIALYGCKGLNSDKSKIMASQLIASMIDLVPKSSDFLPHLDSLMKGLAESLKDLSAEVRAMAAKAFAALTRKFRNETGMKLLNQLKEILEGEEANSTERAGYAQAFAEVLHSLGPEMAKTLIPQALKLTQDSREHIRESFLSVFVYIPMVMGNLFLDFVPSAIENVVESISHEKEKIRNLAIKSLKIVIQNYLQNDFQVLLRPLFEGCLHPNDNKKNSSLILLGDIIQMLVNDESLSRDFIYENYSRIFSLFYIIKNDESSEVRETAKNIYKTFIPNTQRCLRIIFKDLHECFIELFSREQDSVRKLARNGLVEFGNKFADTFAAEMLLLAEEILMKRISRHSEILHKEDWRQQSNMVREVAKIEALLAGQSRFIGEFVANCNNQAMRKVKNLGLINVNNRLCDFKKEIVWSAAFEGLRIFVDRENKTEHIMNRLNNYRDLLTESEKKFKLTLKESPETVMENEKMKKFFTIMLQSRKELILKETTGFLFTEEFKEWQFDVILQNLKRFGNLLYESGPLHLGLSLLFDSYQNRLKRVSSPMTVGEEEFLNMNKFTLNTLSVNIDPDNIPLLIEEFEQRLSAYSESKNAPMIVLTLQSLSYFFEKSVIEDIQFPFSLCAASLRLIAYQEELQNEIFDNVGAFLEIMFRFYNKENCTEIMTGIYNTLKEIVTTSEVYEGLKNPKVIHCLFSLVNQVLRYSTPDATLMALKTAKFMVKTLPRELFKEDQKALYAALLRLLIYKYVPKHCEPLIMKKKLFSFFNFLLDNKIDMGSLRHQFFIYLVMLMNSEFKAEQVRKAEKEDDSDEEEDVHASELVGKKSIKHMTLREVYMMYTLHLGTYFGCLIGYLSSWQRKVENDKAFYEAMPFQEFLALIETQPEEAVAANVKKEIKKMFG